MDGRGYVDGNAGGWTELRVHGVSGTPPTEILEHPNVSLVAGYAEAGFFRRWWEARAVSADGPRRRLEAYSWGGLTSGDNTRALWLLLLPFMLLNVAYFMAPARRAPGQGGPAARRDRLSGSIQSLLALSFTVTFTLTTIAVAMDLVGWQCLAGSLPGGPACGVSWLRWLTSAPFDDPGRQLAVTALVPLAVVGLLWWLGRTTWRNLEAVPVAQSDVVDARTPLEDRALWNGRAAVRRMRALHVAAAMALPGVAALAPFHAPGAAGGPSVVLLAPLLFLLAFVVCRTALPTTGRRLRPEADPEKAWRQQVEQERAERGDLYRHLPWVALGLTAVALVFAATVPAGRTPSGSLPRFVGVVQGVFAAQVLLLLALLGACLLLRPRRPAVRPAFRGLAMPGFALLGWVLAGGISAGVILRAAQFLGTPVAPTYAPTQDGGADHPLIIPSAYSWAAVGGLALGILAAAGAAVVWWRVRRRAPSAATVTAVDAAYTDAPAAKEGREGEQTAAAAGYRARRDRIARAWHEAATLRPEVQRVAGWLLLGTVAVVVVGIVGFATIGPGLLAGAPGLVAVANGFVSLFVLGLVALGRQAYRSAGTRRSVGILWDLGTFWPRAVHPLAPPCYAERAVPDLLLRLQHYTGGGGRVLLSCHSQGSVLGAAVLLQAEPAVSVRTAFLTYGSPLARLYARFFPAYVDPRALERLGGLLAEPADPDGDGDGAAAPDRARWRWRNLHRPSDPIGGPVFAAHGAVESHAASPAEPGPTGVDADPHHVDPRHVDRALRDPVFTRAPGDPCLPPVLGHSDYFADPEFDRAADALRRFPTGADRPSGPSAPARDAGARRRTSTGSTARPTVPDPAAPDPAASGPVAPEPPVPDPVAADPVADEREEPSRRPAPPAVWR